MKIDIEIDDIVTLCGVLDHLVEVQDFDVPGGEELKADFIRIRGELYHQIPDVLKSVMETPK